MVQLRLIGLYRQLSFAAGSWAFSFSYASVAAFALHGLYLGGVPGRAALSWVIAGAATAGLGWLVVRSLAALRAGTFLPRW